MTRGQPAARKNGKPVHRLFVDVARSDARKLIKTLEYKATTKAIRDMGHAPENPEAARVWLDSTWDHLALVDWLMRVKHDCDYLHTGIRAEGEWL